MGIGMLMLGATVVMVLTMDLRTTSDYVWVIVIPIAAGLGLLAIGWYALENAGNLDDNSHPGPDLNAAPLGIPDERDLFS